MRMSEKCHNTSDDPLTSRHTDGGKNTRTLAYQQQQQQIVSCLN